MGKTRIVKSKSLAGALVWLGFVYTKEADTYVFERSRSFDIAWRDLHALRSDYKRLDSTTNTKGVF